MPMVVSPALIAAKAVVVAPLMAKAGTDADAAPLRPPAFRTPLRRVSMDPSMPAGTPSTLGTAVSATFTNKPLKRGVIARTRWRTVCSARVSVAAIKAPATMTSVGPARIWCRRLTPPGRHRAGKRRPVRVTGPGPAVQWRWCYSSGRGTARLARHAHRPCRPAPKDGH